MEESEVIKNYSAKTNSTAKSTTLMATTTGVTAIVVHYVLKSN